MEKDSLDNFFLKLSLWRNWGCAGRSPGREGLACEHRNGTSGVLEEKLEIDKPMHLAWEEGVSGVFRESGSHVKSKREHDNDGA